jgi:NADP-dependent 3-hydroxy acid dehydrogenase YdfG
MAVFRPVSGHVQIDGARVLLTGATGGLGQAMARALARRGAKLVLTGRRTDVLEPLAAETGASTLAVDLADRASVDRLAREAGDVDVLIANAGLPGSGRLDAFSPEEIDRVLDVNLRAPIMLSRALTPGMVQRGRGQLVFISSLSGKATAPASSLYSATKFGMRGFALGLRADLHGANVGVSTVYPGFIRDAGMFHDAGTKLPKGVGTKTPEDVAAAVVRAIEKDPAEIDVAPFGLRAGAVVAGVAPGMAAAVARRLGADKISQRVSSGQAGKR